MITDVHTPKQNWIKESSTPWRITGTVAVLNAYACCGAGSEISSEKIGMVTALKH